MMDAILDALLRARCKLEDELALDAWAAYARVSPNLRLHAEDLVKRPDYWEFDIEVPKIF